MARQYLRVGISVDCEIFGPRGPQPVKTPANQTASISDTVTFRCEGNFGCGDPDTRAVDWIAERKIPGADSIHVWDFSTKSRYSVNNYRSANGAILGSDLTISKVEREDYEWTFHCIMSSARVLNPTQHFSVHLEERPRIGLREILFKRHFHNILHTLSKVSRLY